MPQWKEAQTPYSWIKFSCVWYSKILIEKLGITTLKAYLESFDYGNKVFPDTYSSPPWIKGPLTTTPREQVLFIQKLLTNSLPVSLNAVEQTKSLLYQETLPNGTKLYGKTGWSGSSNLEEHAWFLGWVEINGTSYPLVHLIQEQPIDLTSRLPRLKRLLETTVFL